MASLPPNASVTEIEEELLFTRLLMDSIDPESDDAEAQRQEHQQTLEVLENMLNSRQQVLAFDGTSDYPESYYLQPQVAGPSSAASSGQSATQFFPPEAASRKRPRTQSGPSLQPQPNKSRRTTPSPSTTSPGTPSSFESLELAEPGFEQQRGGTYVTRDAAMQRALEQQKEAEAMAAERARRAREDAAIAQSYMRPQSRAPSSTQNRTQAVLNRDGSFRREYSANTQPYNSSNGIQGPKTVHGIYATPEPSSSGMSRVPILPASPSGTGRAAHGWGTHLAVPKVEGGISPPALSRTSYRPSTGGSDIIDLTGDDDDDAEDVKIIQPTQPTAPQAPSRPPRNGYPWDATRLQHRTLPNGQQQYTTIPNVPSNSNIPTYPATVYSAGQSQYPGYPGYPGYPYFDPYGMPLSQAMTEALHRSQSKYVGSMPGAFPGSELSNHAGPNGSSRVVPAYRASGWAGATANPNVAGGLSVDDLDDLPGTATSRGYGYDRDMDPYAHIMAQDGAANKEDLENLLKNIRPDQDLPPELREGTPDALKCILMEHQKLGLSWLKKMEEGSNKGGILADDMGLGKTIQALALILSRPSEDPRRKTTLIIAPVALMRQWQREIATKVKDRYALKVRIHHGQSRAKDFRKLRDCDVVLTTFGTVATEFKRKEEWDKIKANNPNALPGPKHSLALLGDESLWYRIIIDEAQCIKNRNTQASKAACLLHSQYRFCMTGTPMMNNVEELQALIQFLRIAPYNNFKKFRYDIKAGMSKHSDSFAFQQSMKKLQVLLKAIMCRRTKTSQIDGKPILQLPPRVTEKKYAIFSEDETQLYSALEKKTQLAVNKYLKAGTAMKNYANMLVLLLRLRQACCHPHLITDLSVTGATEISADDMIALAAQLTDEVVNRIKEVKGNFECPICYDAVENPAIFIPCGHDTCGECFSKISDPSRAIALGEDATTADVVCPECRSKINPKKIIDYNAFKKVHQPELLSQIDVAEDEEEEEGSDSESDSSDDDDEDGMEGSDLDGFIVPDGVEDDEDEAERKPKIKKKSKVKAEVKDEDEDGYKPLGKLKFKKSRDEDEDETESDEEPVRNSKSKKSKATSEGSSSKKNGKGKEKAKKKSKAKTLAELKKESTKNKAAKQKYLRRLRRDYITSAKIDKTLEILREVQANDPSEKTIIFSQWTSLLDLLEIPISDEKWDYQRYDGSMDARQRADAVQYFEDRPSCKVMLVSLKAGNAGLNLTAASQVIILDPFWNPYIEEQAIDRAHRIGQQRPVQVHRIFVEGTVEDRIYELQEKKRDLISSALDEKAGQSISRLNLKELTYLFGITT
ncbi:hypothetical protein H2201_001406 [Coniosporium apollinis]|uniref:SWI/SNF family DNA-dependent ATPase Ris1 n=1 Tax=Coniosporium apollinis TaxID=61459 RepID=A0ABQ9P2V3_9PEZI|nr:hypothetical protein H2201_001406 [Coniosporium apollinis]